MVVNFELHINEIIRYVLSVSGFFHPTYVNEIHTYGCVLEQRTSPAWNCVDHTCLLQHLRSIFSLWRRTSKSSSDTNYFYITCVARWYLSYVGYFSCVQLISKCLRGSCFGFSTISGTMSDPGRKSQMTFAPLALTGSYDQESWLAEMK